MKRNSNFKFYFLSLFLINLIFLCFRILNGNFYLHDSYQYIATAKAISSADFTNGLIPMRLILYPLFLSLSITYNPITILLFQSILLFSSFYIFFKILNHFNLFNNKKTLILIGLTPSLFIYSHLIMSEILVLFLLMLLFKILLIDFNFKKIKHIQIILTLLMLTKPVFYPFIFINTILCFIYFIKSRYFSFSIFLPILFLFLMFQWNKKNTGYYHYSSMEKYNMAYFNLYLFKSKLESTEKANDWINKIEKEIIGKNDKEKNTIYKKYINIELSENCFYYSIYHLTTGIRGIVDPGRFDLKTLLDIEDGKQGFLEILNGNKSISSLLKNKNNIYIFLLLSFVFLALIYKWYFFIKYFIKNKISHQEIYILILIIYYVLITGPVNCSRYMMPFQLIIIYFALKSHNQNAPYNQSHSIKHN